MDFDEMVAHFKEVRVSHQGLPLPVPYPATLVCWDGETTVCQVATASQNPETIAVMLSTIAVMKADLAVLSMETVVRSTEGEATDVPIGEDPNSKPGLLTVAAQTVGSEVSVDAFSVDDGGSIMWLPGTWWSPLPSLLVGAMHEVFGVSVPNSVVDFVMWMQVNNYAIRVHPSLYSPPDEEDG